MRDCDDMNAANANYSQAELDKFGALANRWWGEPRRLRESSGLSRLGERPAMDGRAGEYAPWMAVERK